MTRRMFVTAARQLRTEPVRVLEAAVALLATLGIILDADVVTALTLAIPVLIGGEVVRTRVTPIAAPQLDDGHRSQQ